MRSDAMQKYLKAPKILGSINNKYLMHQFYGILGYWDYSRFGLAEVKKITRIFIFVTLALLWIFKKQDYLRGIHDFAPNLMKSTFLIFCYLAFDSMQHIFISIVRGVSSNIEGFPFSIKPINWRILLPGVFFLMKMLSIILAYYYVFHYFITFESHSEY